MPIPDRSRAPVATTARPVAGRLGPHRALPAAIPELPPVDIPGLPVADPALPRPILGTALRRPGITALVGQATMAPVGPVTMAPAARATVAPVGPVTVAPVGRATTVPVGLVRARGAEIRNVATSTAPRGETGRRRGGPARRRGQIGADRCRRPAGNGTTARSTIGVTRKRPCGIRNSTSGDSGSSESGFRCNKPASHGGRFAYGRSGRCTLRRIKQGAWPDVQVGPGR